jgi:hypothetical protein
MPTKIDASVLMMEKHFVSISHLLRLIEWQTMKIYLFFASQPGFSRFPG